MESKAVASVQNLSEKGKRAVRRPGRWKIRSNSPGPRCVQSTIKALTSKETFGKLEELEAATEGRRGATALGAYASGWAALSRGLALRPERTSAFVRKRTGLRLYNAARLQRNIFAATTGALMRIPHVELISLVEEIFKAVGCKSDEAERVANRLVTSNLVGHDSHGVIRVQSYVEWLRDLKILPDRSIEVVFENDSIAVIDGQFGLGQSIGEQTMRLAIEKSERSGVAIVALRNSGHLGRIGDWAEMAAAAGKLSLHFVNTSGAGLLVSPFGGIDRRLSANPIAAAVPTGTDMPVILDMSACVIAEGKVRVAYHRGDTLPDGCLIDADGNPTNNPADLYADPPGAILPIAGHKGYGLSLITDLFAGALSGGSCTNPANNDRVVNNMFTIVIDPSFFASDDAYREEVQRFVTYVKSARTVTEDGEILVPGELEARTKAARLKDGIEIAEVTWGQIVETCQSLGVEHSLL